MHGSSCVLITFVNSKSCITFGEKKEIRMKMDQVCLGDGSR